MATDDSSVKQPLVGAGREQSAALYNLYLHKTGTGKKNKEDSKSLTHQETFRNIYFVICDKQPRSSLDLSRFAFP